MTSSSRTVSRDGESSAAGRGGRRRVDLEIARREVAALAKSLSLTEATRYVSMLQLSGTDLDLRDVGWIDTRNPRPFKDEIGYDGHGEKKGTNK